MGKPHVVAIIYPAQGHVIPLLELVQRLVKLGFKVTFVNTDFNHKRVIKAFSKNDNIEDLINLVSIPDGLEDGENRNDIGKLGQAILQVMPGKLEELIEMELRMMKSPALSLMRTCMGWAVAEKMGIRRATFWCATAAVLAMMSSSQS